MATSNAFDQRCTCKWSFSVRSCFFVVVCFHSLQVKALIMLPMSVPCHSTQWIKRALSFYSPGIQCSCAVYFLFDIPAPSSPFSPLQWCVPKINVFIFSHLRTEYVDHGMKPVDSFVCVCESMRRLFLTAFISTLSGQF